MARTNDVWETAGDGTYIQTIGTPNGYDLLIYGTNHYINFGTTAGVNGYGFRDNGGTMQWKNSGGSWQNIGTGGGGGGVDSVTGLNTDNSDSANPIVKISVDGVTITGLGTPGSPLVAVGGGTVDTVVGTTNRITVDSTDPANPIVDISASYVGQSSITTLGTITTGVWHGTAIANANLANSSVTIGSTNIALGATVTTFAGLVSVTSTTFVGALTGNASTASAVAVGGITGLGTGVATFLATPSSANLISAVTDETGSGALVFGTGPTITLASASTAVTQSPGDSSTKIATTAFVAAAIVGTTVLAAANVATTANLVGVYLNGASGVGATFTYTATGVDTIDGVALTLNTRVLVKNQTTTFQNGIYTVTTAGALGVAGILTRSTDYDQQTDIDLGDQIFVVSGTVNATTTWVQNGTEDPVVGTDPITWAQTTGAGTYTAGNGLSITGTQFSIDTSITVDKTTAQALTNKDLTSGTNTFPTFNQNTSGSAATLTTTRTIWGQNFNGSANVTGDITLGTANITMTGSIGATGARVTKGWFTDLQVTNAIAGSITGNAGTVTGATFTTALTVNGGTLTLTANAANTSVLTIGAGAVSISGSNTGDQTITLTGAVTGSGTGSFATTIATPGTLTVASTNSTATAHTHAITSSSAPGAAASILATDSSGIIGSTGTRIVKIWATDLTVTNNIAGSITGNAATVSNATFTTALTVNGGTLTLTANAANTSVLTIGAGAVSVSGSNTGDQTITLTGAVTGSGTGSFATTIATPGTLTVASTNSTATAHTHAITSSSAPGAAASLLATDSSGIIGSTGTRIVKIWAIDLTVTNSIAGSVTGTAATVTGATQASITSAANLVTIGTVTSGGLGTGAVIGGVTMTLGSDASFDIYYRSAGGVLTRLANGTTGQYLAATTSAAPSWGSPAASLTVGTSAISSGTTTRILYDNAGVLGEYTITGTGTVVAMQGSPSLTTPTITTSAIITNNALGTSTAIGLQVTNTTAAAAGAQQVSPSIQWTGQGWKTTATAATQTVDFLAYVLPVQGAANPTAEWHLRSQVNGGGFTDKLVVNTKGDVGIGGSPNIGGYTGNTLSLLGGSTNIPVFEGIRTDSSGGDLAFLFRGGNTSNSALASVEISSGTGATDGQIDFKTSNAGASVATGLTVDSLQRVSVGGATINSHFTLPAGAAGAGNAPLTFTSGTNLTSAIAGAEEYDGVQKYFTINTSNGRGAIPVEQYQHLTANGSAITTIANFFGTTSNMALVASAYYIIDCYFFFVTTGTGTTTWTFTNSAAPSSQNIIWEESPILGMVAPSGTATMLQGQIINDATAAKAITTGSLTAGSHYIHVKIFLKNGTGTSLKIQATAGGTNITPQIGSWYIARQVSANNIGTFVA